jgi:hypothetical protein
VTVLQPEAVFECLDRHGVRYVLIGGLAAVLHGSPIPTVDVDVCPATDRRNLERLAAALSELDARLRTPDSPEGVRFPSDATFLAAVDMLNLITRVGEVDVAFRPAGTSGFDDLNERAVRMTIKGVSVAVAALEDIIRSKEAANRPKDHRTLPMLRRLLDEIRGPNRA